MRPATSRLVPALALLALACDDQAPSPLEIPAEPEGLAATRTSASTYENAALSLGASLPSMTPMGPLNQSGMTLALDGGRLVVGRPGAAVPSASSAGVFTSFQHTSGTTWSVEATGQNATPRTIARLSNVLAASGDRVLATSTSLGGTGSQVSFFTTDGTQWTDEGDLATPAGSSDFGSALAFDATATLAVIGDQDADRAHVYAYDVMSGTYQSQQEILSVTLDPGSPERFGAAAAIDGDRLVIGAPGYGVAGVVNAGTMIFFERINGSWDEVDFGSAPIFAADQYMATSVAISGDLAFAGAPGQTVNGLTNAGAVHVFARTNTNPQHPWEHVARLDASDASTSAEFGRSIAYDAATQTLVVGAPGHTIDGTRQGAAYLFTRITNGSWDERIRLSATTGAAGDEFGAAVALEDGVGAVGAPGVDVPLSGMDGGPSSGEVYPFEIPTVFAVDDEVTTSPGTPIIIGVLDNDIYPTNPTPNFDVDTDPSNGTAVRFGMGIPASIRYTPDLGFVGEDTFTYGLASGGTSVTGTVRVVVNTPPVANDMGRFTDEDTQLNLNLDGQDVDGAANTEFDFDTTSVAGGDISGSTFDGVVVYTPPPDFEGVDSFTFSLSDPWTESNRATVTITVIPQNDPPVATKPNLGTIREDTPVTITLTGTDVDNQASTLAAAIVTEPDHGTLGPIPVINRQVTYTPNANFNGNDSFVFRLTDPAGASSQTLEVLLNVQPVNDEPVAFPQSYTTSLNTDLSLTLGAMDVDDDTLTYRVLSQPTNGALDDSALPDLVYTPNEGFLGQDTFTFDVRDGLSRSAETTITINVVAPDTRPVAMNESQTIAEDTSIGSTLFATDPLGAELTYAITSAPTNGVLRAGVELPDYVYEPNLNFAGVDSFTFTARSGDRVSEEGTVTITVTPMNDPPVLMDDMVFYAPGEQLLYEMMALEPDEGDTLTYALVDPPEQAQLVPMSNTIAFLSNEAETIDVVASVQDANGAESTATITFAPKVVDADMGTTDADAGMGDAGVVDAGDAGALPRERTGIPGCATGGAGAPGSSPALALLALLLFRRRRPRGA